jgi:hypothetical protein
MPGCRDEERSRGAAATAAALLLATLLAGCASSVGNTPTVLADPGKFQFHNCEQIASNRRSTALRRDSLRKLIDKASQSAGGELVSLLSYRIDYVAANEDLRVLDATARAKNCPLPMEWQSNRAVR